MTGAVLLTGGTGFLGHAVMQRLLAIDKRPMITAVRRSTPRFPASVQVERIGELGPDTDWTACLQGVEVVIHCAARAHVMKDETVDPLEEYRKVNVQGTLALARQAAQSGVRRFVFISSIKVNGERTLPNRPFRADGIPAPEDPYGISKYEAEQGVMALSQESGMEVVIIRPPLVYGPNVKGNFAKMVGWVRKGVPLPLGSVHNQRSLVALENLAAFIVLCSDRALSPLAANEIFLISDDDDVSTTELLRRIAKAYGVKPRLLAIPQSWIEAAARLLGNRAVADRLLGSLTIDNSKARELLRWTPIVSMDEQLKKMAAHDPLI
jgi:nucleoside-diphosphate-sugar epimerase